LIFGEVNMPQVLFDGFGNPVTAYLPSEVADLQKEIGVLRREVEKLKKKAVKGAEKKVRAVKPDE
jgi:transposase-like protein